MVARCVRRAWLWGYDEYADRDYSHRKEWVLERLSELASIFAIDVCAYAVMSNHYHLVLHVDATRARKWTLREVVDRWGELFSLPPLIQRWQKNGSSEGERAIAEQVIQAWRRRLHDVSWLMRCLNEHLARRANAEDNCTGRFWEGRFRSQVRQGDGCPRFTRHISLMDVRRPHTLDTTLSKPSRIKRSSANRDFAKLNVPPPGPHHPCAGHCAVGGDIPSPGLHSSRH